jgi:hypothetical protein
MAKRNLLKLGQIVLTPGAFLMFQRTGADMFGLLERHAGGDWGEADLADREVNDLAVVSGVEVHSAYALSNGVKIWIITAGNRSETKVMLPDEY